MNHNPFPPFPRQHSAFECPEFSKQLEDIVRGTHNTLIQIFNEHGNAINTQKIEIVEQAMAEAFIEPTDVVLELGARYGSVSCRINLKLQDKTKQVSVEPDSRVWDALEKNRELNKCGFHILKGCISHVPRDLENLNVANGYATSTYEKSESTLPCYRLEEVKQMFGIDTFTVVFADCEGCLGPFIQENPTIFDSLRLFLFEADNAKNCNYKSIIDMLVKKDFEEIKKGYHSVWRKKNLT